MLIYKMLGPKQPSRIWHIRWRISAKKWPISEATDDAELRNCEKLLFFPLHHLWLLLHSPRDLFLLVGERALICLFTDYRRTSQVRPKKGAANELQN